ncbi:MAG: patatin-like phospholipase family protein [Nitrospirota bacterium]|nr:patatin-like phospholipase family protein [Nitrospirota bacterium]
MFRLRFLPALVHTLIVFAALPAPAAVPANSPTDRTRDTKIFVPSYQLKYGGIRTVVSPDLKGRPRIGLALAGGGAKAAASLGVLNLLRSEGIAVDAIAGTSMGAIIGGFAAAGYSPVEIERIFTENDWNDLFTDTPPRVFLTQDRKDAGSRHLLQFSFIGGRFVAPPGLTAGQKLTDLLMTHTLAPSLQAGLDFDRLSIPFRAVAADLETGDARAIGKGLLHDAIRASSAIPGLFPPVEIHGKLMVDGGLVNNLPVDVVRSLGADIVIAVDASSPLERRERLTSLVEVMGQSISIPVRKETERQAKLADILISPVTEGFSFTDFDRMDAIMRRGEEAARAPLPMIKEILAAKNGGRSTGGPYPIAGLSVQGNKHMDAAAILAAFPLQVHREWTSVDIDHALADLYRIGVFSDLSLQLVPRGNVYEAILTIVENPVVDAIAIAGTAMIPAGEIMDELDGQLGTPLSSTRVISALESVVKRYRDKGFLLVHIEHAGMLPDGRTLSLVVNEGRLDSLRLSGHRRTTTSLMDREMKTEPGVPLNLLVLSEDIRKLYGLNYFETLNVDVQENRNGGIDLTLKVREKPRGTVRLGLRYDTDDVFTGLTDIVVDNLLGKGIQFSILTRYGNATDVTMGYTSPVLINTSFIHRLEGFYHNRTYYLYQDQERTGAADVSRSGADFSFGYQWFRFGDTYLRYRLSSERLVGIYGFPAQDNPVRTGSLAFLTTIDTRDSSLFPRSGFLFKGSYETAADSYGGDSNFRKTSLSVQSVIPIAERHIAVMDCQAGFGSGTLLYQDLYGLGGADSLISIPLLGYQRREFIGANVIALSFAYRWRFIDYQLKAIKAVYLVLQGNGGNIWDSRESISSRDVLTGGSAGLHADTIIGPVRLDFGAGEDRRYQAYFSAGYDY